MSKAAHFKKLKIDRMYGHRLGLKVDGLSPGVNVIYGPNAAGKSSLARAIAALLWPEQDEKARAFANAVLQIDGSRWSIELEGSRCLYQRDGVGSDRPLLPAGDHRERYQLSLPELLKADNSKFAKAVMQEAVGGVDIEAAARARTFGKPSPNANNRETRRAEEAFRALSEEKERQSSLDRDRRRLVEHRKDLSEATDALRRVQFLDLAIEFVAARDARKELEAVVRRYPAVLAKLTGSEPEDVRSWRLELESRRGEKAAAEDRLAQLKARLVESIIPDEGLEEGFVERLHDRLSEIRRLSEQISRLEIQVADARKREEGSWQHIRGAIDKYAAAGVDVNAVGELAKFGQKAEKVRSRRAAVETLEALLGEDSERPSPDVLGSAAVQLQKWLAEARREGASSISVKLALSIAAVLVPAAGLYAGMTWDPIGFALLLIDVAVGYALFKVFESSKRGSKETYRRDFVGTAVREPASWDVGAVEARLNALYQELADAHIAHQKRRKLGEVRLAAARLAEEEAAIAEKRGSLTSALGIEPGREDEELIYLVERLAHWQAAHVDLERSLSGLDAALTDVDDELSKLYAEIRPYGFERPGDSAIAAQTVAALQKAAAQHADLKREIRDAETERRHASEAIDQLSERIAETFRRAGLEDGDDGGLYQLCALLGEYGERRKELDLAAGAETNRAIKAKSHELCDESLLLGSSREVERRLDEAREIGATAEEIKTRIREIEIRIGEAERGHALEKARVEYDAALQALDEERTRNFRSLLGRLVADFGIAMHISAPEHKVT